MQQALDLAARGGWTCSPNPQVGCVVVKDDKVVGSGYHAVAGQDHAEVIALREAGTSALGADVYVSLEPCIHQGRTPPCVDALLVAQPAKVITTHEDPFPEVAGRGIAKLREAGIECEVGLMSAEARWLNRGFIKRQEQGLPWVTLKTASGLDGRVALPDGSSRWITSPEARREVHELRAASCAIMTGSGTALRDDPQLTARDVGAARQPLRVLVDGQGRCPATLQLFGQDTVVATCAAREQIAGTAKEVLELPGADGQVDLRELLQQLVGRWQINYLLVEAGAGLTSALLSAKLIDEIVAYIAPRFLGAGLANVNIDGGLDLNQDSEFELREVRQVGPDCCLNLVRR